MHLSMKPEKEQLDQLRTDVLLTRNETVKSLDHKNTKYNRTKYTTTTSNRYSNICIVCIVMYFIKIKMIND